MTIERIPDHNTRALSRLLTQYRNSVSHAGIIGAICNQVQALEDAAFALLLTRSIDDASGAQLDIVGDLVGQPREGRDDATFRLWIRARILVNRRSGEVETINDVIAQVLPGAAGRVREFQPAAMEATVTGIATSSADAHSLDTLLRLAKAGGVGIQTIYQSADDAGTFTLAADDETGGGLGLSSGGGVFDVTVGLPIDDMGYSYIPPQITHDPTVTAAPAALLVSIDVGGNGSDPINDSDFTAGPGSDYEWSVSLDDGLSWIDMSGQGHLGVPIPIGTSGYHVTWDPVSTVFFPGDRWEFPITVLSTITDGGAFADVAN